MNSDQTLQLSLVMPVYKKADIVQLAVYRVLHVLDTIGANYEIIAIVDGSPDKSYQNLKQVSHPRLKVINHKSNHGKGAVVREGMQLAQGKYIGFIDCDIDIRAESLVHMIRAINSGSFDA